MPLKRKNPKSRGLSLSDWANLQMLSAIDCWDEEEWRRARENWAIHGERLIEESRAKGEGPPMFLSKVDPARYEALLADWRERSALDAQIRRFRMYHMPVGGSPQDLLR